jgi:hypothetical protein
MRNRASPARLPIAAVRQLALNRSSTTNSRNRPVSAGPYRTIAAGPESARYGPTSADPRPHGHPMVGTSSYRSGTMGS